MALFFAEGIRAMRTDLAMGEAASVMRSHLGFVSLPKSHHSGRQSGCKSRPWGSGLRKRVRSTRLAWGVPVWRQTGPGCDRLGDSEKAGTLVTAEPER